MSVYEQRSHPLILAFGNPLKPAAKPRFKKPRALIELGEAGGNLTRSDRMLVNLLIAVGQTQISRDPNTVVFEAAASSLDAAIVEKCTRNVTRLKHRFRTLCSVDVTLPYLGPEGAPLLHESQYFDERGLFHFAFDADVLQEISNPSQGFAELDLSVCRALTGYSLAVYEVLMLLRNRDQRRFVVPVSKLRLWLGVGNRMARGSDFLNSVLTPAFEAARLHVDRGVSLGIRRHRVTRAILDVEFLLEKRVSLKNGAAR